VLVASMESSPFEATYSARETETVSVLGVLAEIVRTAVRVTPPYDAEIVTEFVAVTVFEVTPNVTLVAPSGTVTCAGTDAAAVLLLASATDAPPDGAAEVSVTVAVEVVPPATVVGLRASEANEAPVAKGLTVSVALLVTPAPDAVIVTTVEALGLEVVTMKAPPPANRGTVTYGGTLATEGSLLESMI
jgi:hypothetical protein